MALSLRVIPKEWCMWKDVWEANEMIEKRQWVYPISGSYREMEGWGWDRILWKDGREQIKTIFIPLRRIHQDPPDSGAEWEALIHKRILGEDFSSPIGYRASAEAMILLGLNVVFCKVGQSFVRHLLHMLFTWAAVGDSETMSSRSSSPSGEKTYVRGCNLQCEAPVLFVLRSVFVKLNRHFKRSHTKLDIWLLSKN